MVETYQADQFNKQLRDLLLSETLNSQSVKIARHANVYICGDQGRMVYYIKSGQVKVRMLAPDGKESILAVYTAGDIFGELCLSGLEARKETVTAMEETELKQLPCSKFLERLSSNLLLEGFVRYFAVRIAAQQQVIADLISINSEQRLGKILLQLSRTLGKKDPRSICIEHKISHEELSEMVGTTRPRISKFMQRFRKLGLIDLSVEHYLIIKENKLTAYLDRIA